VLCISICIYIYIIISRGHRLELARKQWAEPIRGGEFEGRGFHGIQQPCGPPWPGEGTDPGLKFDLGRKATFCGKLCLQGVPKRPEMVLLRFKCGPRCFLVTLGGRNLSKLRARTLPGCLHMEKSLLLAQKTKFQDHFGLFFGNFFPPLDA